MDNEDFVRLHWKNLEKFWTDNDSYGPDVFTVKIGAVYFSDASYNTVWERAAKFTCDLLLKVEEVREEISWLSSSDSQDVVVERLLGEARGRFMLLTKGLKIDA